MADESIEHILETLKQNSADNTQLLAKLYRKLLTEMTEAVELAREITANIPATEEGVKELASLLQIMDGSFVRKAQQVIARADAEAAQDVNIDTLSEDILPQ